MPLEPSRTVADLKELRELTGNDDGAQRVAWTETWETARTWLREKVTATGAIEEIDEAGNQWFTLAGESERAVLIGGHIDSVPNGGWLDGALNVVAGVEVLRRVAESGTPPATSGGPYAASPSEPCSWAGTSTRCRTAAGSTGP